MTPLVHEVSPAPGVEAALAAFADAKPVLFDSAAGGPGGRTGRFSYLTAGDLAMWPAREIVRGYAPPLIKGLPPFQGGAVGLWGYGPRSLGLSRERVARWSRSWRLRPAAGSNAADPAKVGPWLTGGAGTMVADWVLAWDHAAGRAWVVCHGHAGVLGDRRKAEVRLAWVRRRVDAGPSAPPAARAVRGLRLAAGDPPFVPDLPELPGLPGVRSPFTREAYEAAVARVVEYVRAGDIFQANLAQPLLVPTPVTDDWRPLYARLRAENPAPFGGVYPMPRGGPVLSASPERFLSVTPTAGGRAEVEARPIKGTRPRSDDPPRDAAAARELLASEKDRAENVMIVDLLRNDLSKVCEPGSVRAPALCRLESYATVHHLVSEVRGTLRDGQDAWDLLDAAFPGGSITGAPKVRAMEIIDELEPAPRGHFCGAMFWIGFDGAMDSSILIRTVRPNPAGVALAWVGGGITAKSDPAAEYEETLHKAAATLRALGVSPASPSPLGGAFVGNAPPNGDGETGP